MSASISAERIAELAAWDYHVLSRSEEELRRDFVDMILSLELEEVGVRVAQVEALFDQARTWYHNHPYHCFVHAIDVVQAVFALLFNGNGRSKLSNVEQFALLVGALCHDLDHPGFTNDFALLSHHKLADGKEDMKNVLELHHITLSHALIDLPEVKLLDGMTAAQREQFLHSVDVSIAATFMGDHQKYLTEFITAVSEGTHGPAFNDLLCAMILKAADIFNQARPFEVARLWSARFQEETWREGDMRLAKGIELGMFMDRQNPVKLSSMQSGFIIYFVEPLLKELEVVLPDLTPAIEELQRTGQRWESMTMNGQ